MDDKNLGHLRKSYEKNNLDIEDLKGDPIKFFKVGLLKQKHVPKLKNLMLCH